jgi:hypothetical protein
MRKVQGSRFKVKGSKLKGARVREFLIFLFFYVFGLGKVNPQRLTPGP